MPVSAHRHHPRRSRAGRTQQERRAETRSRLLNATADCLADLGWAGLSTTEVARRAGVSRGAQQHHYPTKMVLVAAALEHLVERLRADYEEAFAALPPDRRNVEGALDLLWEKIRQPPALALLELSLAGRTDESLRELSIGINDRVVTAVAETFYRLFPKTHSEEFTVTLIRGTLALMIGLTLQNSLDHDAHGHQAAVLAQTKLLARSLVPETLAPSPSPSSARSPSSTASSTPPPATSSATSSAPRPDQITPA